MGKRKHGKPTAAQRADLLASIGESEFRDLVDWEFIYALTTRSTGVGSASGWTLRAIAGRLRYDVKIFARMPISQRDGAIAHGFDGELEVGTGVTPRVCITAVLRLGDCPCRDGLRAEQCARSCRNVCWDDSNLSVAAVVRGYFHGTSGDG